MITEGLNVQNDSLFGADTALLYSDVLLASALFILFVLVGKVGPFS